MKNVAIVTGATHAYLDLLEELLLNLSHLSVYESCDVCVFDIDFTSEQADRIRAFPVSHHRIEDDPLPIPRPDPARRHLVSTIRPKLRDVFPGYETYVYVDVDVWVQDRAALEGLVTAAADGALVLVPESPAIYGKSIEAPWRRKHERFYGKDVARRMVGRRNWNGGVLALRAESPVWDIWARELQAVIERSGEWFGGSQSAFTYLDMIGSLAIRSLPAVYNWLVAYAQPSWDDVSKSFVSPFAPNERILLVHQNHKSKYQRFKVRLTDGSTVVTTFRYSDYLALRDGTIARSRRHYWLST